MENWPSTNFIGNILAVVILLLISCNDSGKSIQQPSGDSQTTVNATIDSVSKDKNTWIYDTLVNRNHSAYEERTIEIEKNVRLSDSVFYVLYSVGTPVNRIEYILPFINNRALDDVMIGEGADADYSIPFYDYTEYQFVNDTLYHVFNYDQRVKYPEKVLDKDGHFKEGLDFENVDIKTDTTHSRIRINRTGLILRDTVK